MKTSPRIAGLLAIAAACVTAAASAATQVTFYENDDFQGRSYSTSGAISSFLDRGFNDRASSIVVSGKRWEVCEDVGYGGRCMVLREGSYPSLRAMGMNDRISSVRPVKKNATVADDRYGPAAPAASPWSKRGGEQLFEAPVSEVRAIMGAAQQRCWMEKQDVVVEGKSSSKLPGTLLGAVLGGVIGHQIGGGTGRDIATVGGAVAGGALGSRVGADGRSSVESRDVQRCSTEPNERGPEYWDVTYSFRGQQHHAQLKQPPGATITVNGQGEPRE